MRNVWMVVVVALAMVVTSTACGSGNGNGDESNGPAGDDDAAGCGDGVCVRGHESHASCPEDCPPDVTDCENGTCDSDEDCYTCPADCGCGDGQTCTGGMEEQAAVCRPTNPLIAKIPGTWMRIEPNDGLIVQVTVDPAYPSCGGSGDPGDACISGFSPLPLILSGSNLHWGIDATAYAEGRVLEDGRRVEFDDSGVLEGGEEVSTHYVYTKQ